MRCARCQRFILKPAATVTAQGHQLGYGPRCAEVMALLPPRVKNTRIFTSRRTRKNDKQMELLA